ncbi:MAG: branched-chain amino acid ABC transporter permease [Corynebacteriales bacterium]|nr:branched-chain amino acid ABC transporter permease [Mycobacteriales bacterium]
MEILQNALKALVAREAIYFALLAIGLNIQFGYAGLLNFGQVGFSLLGAYGIAITVTTWGGSYWLGLGVGLAAAVVLALLLGLPTLRLRADYLAIATIAAAEMLRLGFRTPSATEITGGTQGLQGFSGEFYELSPFPLDKKYHPFGILFTGQELWLLTVGWTLVALLVLAVWLWGRSPWGRVLKAIREDEDAARALGKNVYWYKMQALIVGGVIGALGGAVQATATRSVDPDTYLPIVTFYAYAALILGGTARPLGPVIGASLLFALLSVTDSVLRDLTTGDNPVISSDILDSQAIAATRFVLVGAGLIALMAFRPQGIFGSRTEVSIDAK